MMTVLLVFIEGILSFISPCILPMLPVFLMFLAGNSVLPNKKKLILNTLSFILGFTIVFVVLGATATSIGKLLSTNRMILQRISGFIIILFGLNFMEVINIKFLNITKGFNGEIKNRGILGSFLFGLAFSFGWTPCLGTFLGSALLIASNSQTVLYGMSLLFVFSMGLGIPFLITAIIFEKLSNTFIWIKKNYSIITKISGGILIIIGLLMLLDIYGYYAGLFNW